MLSITMVRKPLKKCIMLYCRFNSPTFRFIQHIKNRSVPHFIHVLYLLLHTPLHCLITIFRLELILGDKHGDFGYVSSQLDSPLQFAHLHLCLQGGGTMDGAHQHELASETV